MVGMKSRLFVGLLLVIVGFLTFYSAYALTRFASPREYVLPLVGLGLVLIFLGAWLVNPGGIWSKD